MKDNKIKKKKVKKEVKYLPPYVGKSNPYSDTESKGKLDGGKF